MKHIIIFQLFLLSLFAHSGAHEHTHFFSTLHLGDFVLLIAAIVGIYFLYEKLYKAQK